MAAETLPGWLTACSDLESSISVLLIRQGKRGKGRSCQQLSCAEHVPAPSLALRAAQHQPQRTAAELQFIMGASLPFHGTV